MKPETKWQILCGLLLVALLAGAALSAAFVRRAEQALAAATRATTPTPPPVAPAGEAEFIRQGILLQEYCAQGVSLEKFSDQLVQVKVAFRGAGDAMHKANASRWRMFDHALRQWEIAQGLWSGRLAKNRAEIPRSDLEGAALLEELNIPRLSPGVATWEHIAAEDYNGQTNPTGDTPISSRKLARVALSKGAESFQRATEFVDVATEIKRIKAMRKAAGD